MKQARPKPGELQSLIELLMLVQEYAEDGTIDGEECGDNTFVARLNDLYHSGVGNSWQRVIFGMQTAFDHATDPNSPVVDWKPEFKQALKEAGLIHD